MIETPALKVPNPYLLFQLQPPPLILRGKNCYKIPPDFVTTDNLVWTSNYCFSLSSLLHFRGENCYQNTSWLCNTNQPVRDWAASIKSPPVLPMMSEMCWHNIPKREGRGGGGGPLPWTAPYKLLSWYINVLPHYYQHPSTCISYMMSGKC